MAAQLVQMVTVVDKSGKAVKSSKHVFGVWKEAKAAYKERKAQLAADRCGVDVRSPKGIDSRFQGDDMSRASSRSHSKPHRRRRHHSHEDRHRSPRSPSTAPTSPTIYMPQQPKRQPQPGYFPPVQPVLQRSFTDTNGALPLASPPPKPVRSYTSPSAIDMDLAYGEDPDDLTTIPRGGQEEEMSGLVSKVKFLLEEADCLQHSASKTIAMLQKNPEAMAAVALTLAEISKIAKTVAPGALANISKGAPAVFSLLASPQFLIAGGVAVGLTVVAFGGYKIIKQIRAKQDDTPDELLEVNTDLSRIETWRRGITTGADDDTASIAATSVEGEFITPQAAALSRLNLHETKPAMPRSHASKSGHRSGKHRSSHSRSDSRASSESSSKPLRRAETSPSISTSSTSTAKPKDRQERKAKKPSPLRLMFR